MNLTNVLHTKKGNVGAKCRGVHLTNCIIHNILSQLSPNIENTAFHPACDRACENRGRGHIKFIYFYKVS